VRGWRVRELYVEYPDIKKNPVLLVISSIVNNEHRVIASQTRIHQKQLR
jgi:hypothetical protein